MNMWYKHMKPDICVEKVRAVNIPINKEGRFSKNATPIKKKREKRILKNPSQTTAMADADTRKYQLEAKKLTKEHREEIRVFSETQSNAETSSEDFIISHSITAEECGKQFVIEIKLRRPPKPAQRDILPVESFPPVTSNTDGKRAMKDEEENRKSDVFDLAMQQVANLKEENKKYLKIIAELKTATAGLKSLLLHGKQRAEDLRLELSETWEKIRLIVDKKNELNAALLKYERAQDDF